MIYQHPLTYLLGLEGVALLRAYAGDYDREFGEARIAEIRKLLDGAASTLDGVVAARVDTVEGYRVWSTTYDEPGNGLFPYEEAVVHEILGALPPGVALDAACGTGRHSEYLARQGHHVIGVDNSPDMLDRARTRVPEADFRLGELHSLPLTDDHIDVIVCALALCHLPELGPVFAEFARVLRPGGHLVVTDVHHELIALGSVPHVRLADGAAGLLPAYRHRASDYLRAALPLGLQVRRCEEPRNPGGGPRNPGSSPRNPGSSPRNPGGGQSTAALADLPVGPWDEWPWSLHGSVPAATDAAFSGLPAVFVWHFQSNVRPALGSPMP